MFLLTPRLHPNGARLGQVGLNIKIKVQTEKSFLSQVPLCCCCAELLVSHVFNWFSSRAMLVSGFVIWFVEIGQQLLDKIVGDIHGTQAISE